MTPAAPSGPAAAGTGRLDWLGLACAAAIAAATIAAYGRTSSVPFLHDDIAAIRDNPTIRHWENSLRPPIATTVTGRPVLNLSLAINYAVSGTSVSGYHITNVVIHILSGLVLFGILRRTLRSRAAAAATGMAFATALLWSLHPLQTESVTYLVQRAESLMGLLYLLTLYCFVRGVTARGWLQSLWFASCVCCCALGMATKEVMASAPLMVLLYDRTFVAGGFGEAIVRRWKVYVPLAGSWLVLASLILSSNGRNGTVGFGVGVTWWSYALTQLPAIAHYLWLCFWPHSLVFDYGAAIARPSAGILPYAGVIVGLLAATLWALVKRPEAGFLGAWFFAILAPSSSIVPVATETMAEHRMYLALIPVVLLVVLGIYRCLGRMALPACLLLAASLGLATAQRNTDYSSELAIWRDTVAKRPGNPRAHNNLGNAWANVPGRQSEMMAEFVEALRLKPDYLEAHSNLGNALLSLPGRLNDAIAELQEAIRLNPNYAQAHNNLGNAWSLVPGRSDDAIANYREAIRLEPDYAEAHYNLGRILAGMPGRSNEAIAEFAEALRVKPDFVEAHYNLGNLLALTPGRADEAIAQYQEALRLAPDLVEAHYNLGSLLTTLPGRASEAIAQYAHVLRLRPDSAATHFNLAVTLLRIPGRGAEAQQQLQEVLRLEPGNDRARKILEAVRASSP